MTDLDEPEEVFTPPHEVIFDFSAIKDDVGGEPSAALLAPVGWSPHKPVTRPFFDPLDARKSPSRIGSGGFLRVGKEPGQNPWGIASAPVIKASGCKIFTGRAAGISSNSGYSTRSYGTTFHNCAFRGMGETYWGVRMYDQAEVLFDNCGFMHIGHWKEITHNDRPVGKWEGHPIYLNIHGDLVISHCTFMECLGQLQLVWRASETRISDPAHGLIVIEHSLFMDLGAWGDRCSFPISIFNPGQSVNISNVEVRTTKRTPLWRKNKSDPTNYRSKGGLLIGQGQSDTRTPTALIEDLRIYLDRSDRAAMKLEGIDELEIVRGEVFNANGGPARIDVHPTCKSGRIKGVDGEYEIRRKDALGKWQVVSTGGEYSWGV